MVSVIINKILRSISRKYPSSTKEKGIEDRSKKKENGILDEYFSKTILENVKENMNPQRSENDDTEGIQTEDVM